MTEAVAGPAGNAIQVVPPDAEFKGPFTGPTKSNHTMTNISAGKVCIKLKVFDNAMVQCKPIAAFMNPGQQMPLLLIHKPFAHSATENYEKRRVGIFYVDASDSGARDAMAFSKDVPAANWKMVKMQCKYVGDEAPKGSTSGAAKAAAAAPPPPPPAETAAPPAEAAAPPPADTGAAPPPA